MKKRLTTAGNTWQLYLNKPLIQLLGLNKDEYKVVLIIDNKKLIVRKALQSDNENSLFVKKLIKRSSSFGLNFPLVILELLEIDPEKDFLDIELDNNRLIIKKFNN